MDAEKERVRMPLPTPEEISNIATDGGAEFNRLVFEKSPYLLQHARNPIDWWPWGEAAFEKAHQEDKPVLLSVGYTTCHWCHVMEHESFEDQEVAALVNENFIPIKVDREERPDIDEVYMQVTQGITGSGGWPMTVAMTPEKDAFFAGTYFPKESIAGRFGFKHIITELGKAWRERREEVEESARSVSRQLGEILGASPGGDLDLGVFDAAFDELSSQYDAGKGGFARSPKFPVTPNLLFLLRVHRRTGNAEALAMVEKTLTEIRRGGIYDQVGFGIYRYSTDADWLLPHFEKMLYDQALVTMAYLEVYQVTGKERYARTAREILTYVLRNLTDPEGGFYSAEDADSEGKEGKFYLWTNSEVKQVLGEDDGKFFIETFHFEEEGNFLEEVTREKTGTNIPHLKEELLNEKQMRVDGLLQKLFNHRETRIHPQKDDKILTDWNGLMIAAFARAAQVLGDEDYAESARKATDFVLDKLTSKGGRLVKRYRQGEAGLTAHFEDYAFMIWGLLDVYEMNFDLKYLAKAIELQEIADKFFWDKIEGGYFTVAEDAEQMIVRAKKIYGGPIPSGNSVAIGNLVRLHRMTGQPHFATRGDELIRAFSAELAKNSAVYPLALTFLDFHFGPSYEIVISGGEGEEMVDALRNAFIPNKVIIRRTSENAEALAELAPFTEELGSQGGQATAYVCQNFTCQLPTIEVEKLMQSLLRSEQNN